MDINPWFTKIRRLGAYFNSTRLWPLAVVIAAVSSVAVVYLSYRDQPGFLNQYDDAYVTFRYAVNLGSGQGLVFNPGERTDAASSFLYTVVLAGAYALGARDLEVSSTILGLLSLGALVVAVGFSAYALTQRALLSAALGTLSALHGFISGWSISGMETVFFAALAAAFAGRLLLGKADWLTAILLSLALLSRFESLIFLTGWFVWLAPGLLKGEERRKLVWLLGFPVAVFAALILFKWLYYGTVLPGPLALKRISLVYQPNPTYLSAIWEEYGFSYLVVAAVALLARPRLSPQFLAFLWILGLSAVSVVLGPFSDWARYSVFLLPLLVIGASEALGAIASVRAPLVLIPLVWMALDARSSFEWMRRNSNSIAGHQRCRKEVGEALRRDGIVGPVLSSDIGAIAYVAKDTRFLDVLGLTSKSVLDAYEASRNLDQLLADIRPPYVADTLFVNGRYVVSDYLEPIELTVHSLPHSDMFPTMQFSPPITFCRAGDFRAGYSQVSYGR